MRFILLAAAAVIAMPALAQQSGSTGTSSPTTSGAQGAVPPTAGDNTMSQPAPTQSMPSQSMPSQSMPSQSMPGQSMPDQSMPAPATPMASGDPVGGYQPATAPTAGVFQAAPTPDQAYPAPAPLAHYPVCKKGEFDKCIQGPRSTHSREVRGRKS